MPLNEGQVVFKGDGDDVRQTLDNIEKQIERLNRASASGTKATRREVDALRKEVDKYKNSTNRIRSSIKDVSEETLKWSKRQGDIRKELEFISAESDDLTDSLKFLL